MDEPKLLLKCSEAAKRLSMGRAKVYLMAASGELPSIRIGRAIRISAESLREWVRRKQVEAEDCRSADI